MASVARDLGVPSDTLDAFAESRIEFEPATLQAIVQILWGGHVEFDAERDLLRSANKSPATSLGVGPPQYKPNTPPVVYGLHGLPRPGPKPVVPEKPKPKGRPGWIGGLF